MKVGVYQFDIKIREVDNNLKKVKDNLKEIDADLVVLPELFTTGYLFSDKNDLRKYSENIPEGKSVKALEKIAKNNNIYIIGGLSEKEEDKIYNTAVLVGPEGYIGKYRKIHLTDFEKNIFDEGNEIKVFDIEGTKIGIAICFDTWFPELLRLMIKKGAQIICHPANFGGPYSLNIIKTRAMENMVYTVTSNRIGTEQGDGFDATFLGNSLVLDTMGEELIAMDDEEQIKIVDIDPNKAKLRKNIICNDLNYEMNKYKIESILP